MTDTNTTTSESSASKVAASECLLQLGLRLCLILMTSLTFALANAQQSDQDDPINLTYLFSDGNLPGTLNAYRALLDENPQLQGRIDLNFVTESLYDQLDTQTILDADVLVLDMMNQAMMDRFNADNDTDLLARINEDGTVLAVGIGIQPREYYTDQGAVFNDDAMAYWQNGGQQNQLALMKYAVQLAGVEGLTIPEPEQGLDFGYYYPDEAGGRVFSSWEEFQSWRQANDKTGVGRLQVAVGFYRASFYTSETDVIDALIAEIEAQGAEAIPFFGYPGQVAFERMLLDETGNARADVALSLLFRFADFDSTRVLADVNIPVINLPTLYGRSEQEWRESATGLSLFEGTFQIAVPELAGLTAPTVVGSRERVTDPATGLTITVSTPIQSRITMAVRRGIKLARLRQKANANKRIALMYYNYPAGKANIGASYLNIAESLELILRRMQEEGYDVGSGELTADRILDDITNKARNIGSYAPGDLQEMIAFDSIAPVYLDTYQSWLNDLAPSLKEKIESDWGDVEDVDLMTASDDNGRLLVIPRLEYGNIILMPQPARGWGEDLEMLYHADDLAPHHQYVAAYSWLRNEVDVDAIVHLGTHGTLEWLDGKDTGLSREDAPDALIADIPNLNIYNVDVVGEGLIARRRGMATLIDHMVPAFVKSDLYSELAELSERINDYHNNLHKNEELATIYAQQIIEQLEVTGIAKSLDVNLQLDANGELDHEVMHVVQDHMIELREQFIPYGLHAFGRLPDADMRRSTVQAIVSTDRSLLPEDVFILSAAMEDRIIKSASRELDSLINGLAGGYIGTGSGGEPIRNPDAYPTGKNFYGIDPDKIPKKAAWELGVKMADQMLADHVAEHGEYPRKVSFVIWGDETMRHEGVVESQIFHLLGTRPVWDERDKVVDVEIIPSRELGRPRVDILIASAAEGMFHNVTVLMDKAVQQVKLLEETENFVREHYLQTQSALVELGYSEEDAERRAGVRIFDEPPGVYNLNTSNIAAASGSWDSDLGMANDYINKMGHGFGNGFWGEPMQDAFKLALDGVEKVVHSSSTTLYGALDNDDFFMYMGGLAASVRTVSGDDPELLVTNTRNPGQPEMSSLNKFIGTEFSTRYVNPNWITGMQQEGYAGARNMVEFVEYLWGWDATVTDVVDNNMWDQAFEVYVQDKHALGMEEFFDNNSPYAFQDMSARMLETVRKDYWQADEDTLQELLQTYLESVRKHGISCTTVSCGNPRLLKYVLEQGQRLGIAAADLENFRAEAEEALQGNIEELAVLAEQFARTNDARIAELYQAATGVALEGYRLEQIEQDQPTSLTEPVVTPPANNLLLYLLQGLLLLTLLYWWWHRRWLRRQTT